jgi:hypothetical protein
MGGTGSQFYALRPPIGHCSDPIPVETATDLAGVEYSSPIVHKQRLGSKEPRFQWLLQMPSLRGCFVRKSMAVNIFVLWCRLQHHRRAECIYPAFRIVVPASQR